VHGDKELVEKLGRDIPARAVLRAGFKRCCMKAGKHDGTNRAYFF